MRGHTHTHTQIFMVFLVFQRQGSVSVFQGGGGSLSLRKKTRKKKTEWKIHSPTNSMVVEMVPLKGGLGSIFHPPGSARTISGI